jgi:TonB-dependent SusC/RagA subfamily outer membrane receptor
MKSTKTLIFLIAVLFSLHIFSQKEATKEIIKLTILVKDADNNPIPGAVILIDDVKQKRTTNSAGYFKIKLDKAPKEITAFSPLIGVKKIPYTGKNSIIINIIAEKNSAYLTDTNTEKVSDAIQFRDIYDYLRGKVAGVNISTSNIISIRGISTMNGNREPLFILNGVQIDENSFRDIVPTTIRNVKILKGPETAIYGLRGANGVIEVVTTIN